MKRLFIILNEVFIYYTIIAILYNTANLYIQNSIPIHFAMLIFLLFSTLITANLILIFLKKQAKKNDEDIDKKAKMKVVNRSLGVAMIFIGVFFILENYTVFGKIHSRNVVEMVVDIAKGAV